MLSVIIKYLATYYICIRDLAGVLLLLIGMSLMAGAMFVIFSLPVAVVFAAGYFFLSIF